MKTERINIFTGPQFREGKAVFPFFVAAILILFAIVSIVQGRLDSFFCLLPFILIVINFMLDFQGVEIDKENNRVRVYKLDLIFKYGTWMNFKEFTVVGLEYETYVIKEWTVYTSMTTVGRRSQYTNTREGHFLISLVNSGSGKNIILAERFDYTEAKATALQMADKTGLPFHNFYKDRVDESKRNRTHY